MDNWKFDNDTYDKIRRKAIEQKLIFGNLKPEEADYTEVNFNLINEIQNKPRDIFVDEEQDLLYFKDENGEKVYIPELNDGFTSSDIWISDLLPDINMD